MYRRIGINGLIFSNLSVVKMVFSGCFRKSGVNIFCYYDGGQKMYLMPAPPPLRTWG